MFHHYGLFFTREHVQQARENRAGDPYAAAWALLDTYQPSDALSQAQHNALRYRFADDVQAGAQAVQGLQRLNIGAPDDRPYIEQAAALVTLAQCFEMLRDHPAWNNQAAWLAAFDARLHTLQRPLDDLPFVDQAWLNTLALISAIVLEREDALQQAVAVFKGIIDHDIHPEGYILKTVQMPAEQQGYYGDGLYRMLLTAQALILAAEAASHVGADLWAYNNRGVSVMTPLPYLLYYYYFPDKWRWDEGLEVEPTQALYRAHAGMWDMAQRQAFSRDRKVLLDELRPIYDVWGGGLTTLTHGGTGEPRKRRGWFG